MITLTRIQARVLEVESILGRAPALRLNEIALLQMKDGSHGLMTADEGGLRWVKADELREYIAACRDALDRSEALLIGPSRRGPEMRDAPAPMNTRVAEPLDPAPNRNQPRDNSGAPRALRQQSAGRVQWLGLPVLFLVWLFRNRGHRNIGPAR